MIDTSLDWKIHKKLRDERDEQRMRRMLFHMGRGNGKTRWLEELGYAVTRTNPEPTRLRNSDIQRIRDIVVDYDLYSNIVSPMCRDRVDRLIDEMYKDYYGDYRMTWEPKIRLDTTVCGDSWYWQQLMYNVITRDAFKLTEESK